jgi:hypothetical protein
VAVHLASKAQSSLEDLHFAISRSSVTSVLELYLTVSPQPSKKIKKNIVAANAARPEASKALRQYGNHVKNATDTPISLPSCHFYLFRRCSRSNSDKQNFLAIARDIVTPQKLI